MEPMHFQCIVVEFDLTDATHDVSLSYGAKEKAQSAAKLAGKTIFNTGVFAGKAGVELLKKSPDILKRMAEEAEKRKLNQTK